MKTTRSCLKSFIDEIKPKENAKFLTPKNCPLIARCGLQPSWVKKSKRITDAGADMLHFDVMDGHFVPNFAMSPPFIAAVREVTQLPFDVHIMVMHPLRYIDALAAAGADLITFSYREC